MRGHRRPFPRTRRRPPAAGTGCEAARRVSVDPAQRPTRELRSSPAEELEVVGPLQVVALEVRVPLVAQVLRRDTVQHGACRPAAAPTRTMTGLPRERPHHPRVLCRDPQREHATGRVPEVVGRGSRSPGVSGVDALTAPAQPGLQPYSRRLEAHWAELAEARTAGRPSSDSTRRCATRRLRRGRTHLKPRLRIGIERRTRWAAAVRR